MQQDSSEPPSLKPPTPAPNSGNPSSQQPQILITTTPEQENLQCPRCNSTNTKFCYYYNNRNLSQARHFCKSCRRFWIKWTPDSVDRRYLNPPPVPLVLTPEPENIPCPRCNSANTKFYRYNYYNLSKPRYFCRACRRSWTKGGILMDIPEGSGISRRCGRRSGKRADPAPIAPDCEVPVNGDCEDPVAGDYEIPVEASSEGDLKFVKESSGEPFLNGWSLGRDQGSDVSRSAGFEEMGFGRPV